MLFNIGMKKSNINKKEVSKKKPVMTNNTDWGKFQRTMELSTEIGRFRAQIGTMLYGKDLKEEDRAAFKNAENYLLHLEADALNNTLFDNTKIAYEQFKTFFLAQYRWKYWCLAVLYR